MASAPRRLGFEGELIESGQPDRADTTERMIGIDGSGTTNEMILTPRRGGTRRHCSRVRHAGSRPAKSAHDAVRGGLAWESVFRLGSIFRKGYTDSPRNRSYLDLNSVRYHLHLVKVKRHAVADTGFPTSAW